MALNPLDPIVRDLAEVKRQLAGRSQLNHSSLENTAIPVYDGEGQERLRIGAQDDGTHSIKYVQGPPPPRPTAPVVSVDGPVVRVRWDGILMGGHIPEDFARIDVHFALASDDIEDESAVRGNLATPAGNETVLAATQTGTYRVGLVAMSQSRARSEMSETVEVEVTLVNIEGALDSVVDNARGGSNYYSPEPPSGTDHDSDRDLWFDTSEGDEGLTRYTPHRWDEDAQEWVSIADERVEVIADAQADLESELNTVRQTADGKNRTYYQSTMPGPSTTPAPVLGDLWFNTANGFRLHRHNGSTFIEVADGRIAEVEAAVENIDISGPLSEARGEWLADAAADAQQKAQAAADAAEAAAKLYADAVATGAVEGELEGIQDYADQAAEAARQAALDAAIAEARVIANEARDEALAAALDADAVISQSIAQFESDLSLVRETADGKNSITWSPNTPSGEGKSGDTWFRTSGNNIIGHWRHSGSSWVSMSLDATVIPNLDAGKITSGLIDAERIAANSITADKLLVGGAANLVSDPEFTSYGSSTGWATATGGSVTAGEGVGGSAALRLPAGSSQSGVYLGLSEARSGYRAKVAGGVRYRLSAYVRASDFSGDPFVAQLYMRFFTREDKAAGSYSWGSSASASFRASALVDGEWALISFEVVAPEGAVEAAPGLYKASQHTTSPVEFSAPSLVAMTGATLIENGAITTEKITAGAVGATAIAAESIDASKIVAGGIQADSLIVPGTVGSTLIRDGAITTSKIEAGAITAQSGIIASLDAGVISSGTIDAARIQAGSLDGGVVLSEGSVGTTVIAGGAITTEKIATGAITAESGIIGSLDLGVATVGELNGGRIEAGTIDTEQLAFGSATGDVLSADAINGKRIHGVDITGSTFRAGDAVEITGAYGLRQYGPDGALNVDFPSDGSPASIRGDFSARRLSAYQLQLTGETTIASGADMVIESGVTAPTAAPRVTPYWERLTMPPLTSDETAVGLVWGEGHWWRLVTTTVGLSNGGRTRVEKIDTSGELVDTITTTFRVGANGITYLNGELYLLVHSRYLNWDGKAPDRAVVVYNTAGVEQRRWAYPSYGTGFYQPGIGTNGTNIVIAQCWQNGELTYRRYSPTGSLVAEHHTSAKVGADMVGFVSGNLDYGSFRTVFAASRASQVGWQFLAYTGTGSNLTYQRADSWTTPGYHAPRGLAWDGEYLWSLEPDGNLVRYAKRAPTWFAGDHGDDWWMAVSWRDHPAESLAGPPGRFEYPHRAQLLITLPDAPKGVTGIAFFVAKGDSEPTRTQLHWENEINQVAPVVLFTALAHNWGTRRPPLAESSFTDSEPSEIRSAIGNFRVDGVGAGEWGPLKFHADGSMTGLPKVAAGRVSIPADDGTSGSPVTVTFPAGRFSSAPSVTLTADSSSPSSISGVTVRNVTRTSVDIRLLRTGSFNTVVHWIAVEQE